MNTPLEASYCIQRHLYGAERDLAARVLNGLSASQKFLEPMLFYDERGSELFEQICECPEYYVTRAERSILEDYSKDITAFCDSTVTVIELGSGNAEKTEVLLKALVASDKRVRFLPIDISEAAVVAACDRVSASLPSVDLDPIVSTYEDGLLEARRRSQGQRLTLFLGGNIGNMEPQDARAFLQSIHTDTRAYDMLLLGADLIKDPKILRRAYDDAAGITAEFNFNVLHRLNAELGANFDLKQFAHRARWNPELNRIEMHLQSLEAQSVRIDALGEVFDFEAGETIHTESSHKYSFESLDALGRDCGWQTATRWTEEAGFFSLTLFRPFPLDA